MLLSNTSGPMDENLLTNFIYIKCSLLFSILHLVPVMPSFSMHSLFFPSCLLALNIKWIHACFISFYLSTLPESSDTSIKQFDLHSERKAPLPAVAVTLWASPAGSYAGCCGVSSIASFANYISNVTKLINYFCKPSGHLKESISAPMHLSHIKHV